MVKVGERAWPVERRNKLGELTEDGIRITWTSGQSSALDARSIANSRDVGTIRVFDAKSGNNLPHDVMFAFAFHAFHPIGEWKLSN